MGLWDFLTAGTKHKGQHQAGKHTKQAKQTKQPRIPKSKKGKK